MKPRIRFAQTAEQASPFSSRTESIYPALNEVTEEANQGKNTAEGTMLLGLYRRYGKVCTEMVNGDFKSQLKPII